VIGPLAMIFLMLACTSAVDTDDPVGTPADTDSVFDTALSATGDTAVPPPELFRPEQLDCGELPPLPTSFTNINGQGPYEDFAFDAFGNLVGVDGSGSLRAKPRTGQASLLATGVGVAKGTRFLPDGSVAVALPEIGVVGKVVPGGGQTVLASVPNTNGVAVDIHGNVWTTTADGRLVRIKPNGDRLEVANVSGTLDGVAFAPDYRTIYFDSEFGQIRRLAVDEAGDPEGPVEIFASVPIAFAVLDGMTTDMCGNIYAARMDGRVYRFLPDGTLDGIINLSSNPGLEVIPAINFGSGVGGFERDRLYAMNFLGGVIEADIGIEGRWEPHYPLPQ